MTQKLCNCVFASVQGCQQRHAHGQEQCVITKGADLRTGLQNMGWGSSPCSAVGPEWHRSLVHAVAWTLGALLGDPLGDPLGSAEDPSVDPPLQRTSCPVGLEHFPAWPAQTKPHSV